MDFPSFKELFNIGRDEILARNSQLTKAVIEQDGTDANALVAAGAAVGDELVGQLAAVEAGVFGSSAKGKALDRLLFDRYGLTRKPASPAIGSVSFSLPTANPSAFSIPIGTRLKTTDGKSFFVTQAAVFPMSSVGPVVVAVQSTAAGASQQASSGTITIIQDFPAGAPGTLTVTNTLATAGAADTEDDASYLARGRAFFTTARRGTIDAIQQGALAVPGVKTATAIEQTDPLGRPVKSVQLAITDAFTEALVNVSPVPAAYQTQSQQLATNVFLSLPEVRGAGIYVFVFVAKIRLLPVVLGLSFQGNSSLDIDQVAFNARAAVLFYVNSLAPGQTFSKNVALNILRSVQGLIVTGNEFISPPGDVIPTALQALRSSLGMIVASTVQPDMLLQGSANPDG